MKANKLNKCIIRHVPRPRNHAHVRFKCSPEDTRSEE